LGLKSDAILHHATPRIFYGCELGAGARNALLGLEAMTDEAPTCGAIGAAWRRRWLSKRALRTETLEALARLGATSVRASLHADENGQFSLDIC
ncbi:MAG: Druantia anti-phage system protein DruA, partial [Bradyrhizobium sp.]